MLTTIVSPRSLCVAFFLVAQSIAVVDAQESPFRPDQSKLPTPAPKEAIVLFDGTLNRFVSMSGDKNNWNIVDGCLVSTHRDGNVNHIVSTWHFRDADIHVEFAVAPQESGNSGIYIHGNYEMQIYNSIDAKEPNEHDEGALYGFSKPLVNAARPVGEWQVYDIRYRAPRRDDQGKITEAGHITAWLNGQLVQDDTRFEEPRSVYHPFRYGTTKYLERINRVKQVSSVGPVFLQDHGSPTRFRNIWIVPLDDQAKEWKE